MGHLEERSLHQQCHRFPLGAALQLGMVEVQLRGTHRSDVEPRSVHDLREMAIEDPLEEVRVAGAVEHAELVCLE